MHFYTSYGLKIQSEIPLPELVPGGDGSDIIICVGKVERPTIVSDDPICLLATADDVYLAWDDVGLFLIRSGREIIIDPAPTVTQEILRLFILGSGLAVLLHQRGLLVLHASACAVGGGVVAFIGDKGWGKSTTAAALHKRGHPLMTDDLVAIQMNSGEAFTVLTGYPQFKLWPEAIASLGEVAGELPRIRPQLDKRALRVTESFSQTPLPLHCIYVLGGGEVLETIPLPPQIALMQLIRHTYVSRYGTAFSQATGAAKTFAYCSMLVKHIPIRCLRRKNDLSALSDIAQLIEADALSLIQQN